LLMTLTQFTKLTKFLINNPENFLLAPLLGILYLACSMTWQDIPDNSYSIY
jgi:hypothetical protein